jgi:tRNA A37 N6-isopentenylltransferase MiaA
MNDGSRGPTLVVLIGPSAVGKMTVGQELMRLTGFRLFYNHQVIDLLTTYFPFGSPSFNRLEPRFRTLVIEEAAASGLSLIVTSARRWTEPEGQQVLRTWLDAYAKRGYIVCIAELNAPLAVRLERHHGENRRRHKRVAGISDAKFRQFDAINPWDSSAPLPADLPYLRLDTEHLTAEATARRIREHFGLPVSDAQG